MLLVSGCLALLCGGVAGVASGWFLGAGGVSAERGCVVLCAACGCVLLGGVLPGVSVGL